MEKVGENEGFVFRQELHFLSWLKRVQNKEPLWLPSKDLIDAVYDSLETPLFCSLGDVKDALQSFEKNHTHAYQIH